MTQANPTDRQLLMLGYRCDYCGAKVGEWCTKRGPLGEPAQSLHTQRAANWWIATYTPDTARTP